MFARSIGLLFGYYPRRGFCEVNEFFAGVRCGGLHAAAARRVLLLFPGTVATVPDTHGRI